MYKTIMCRNLPDCRFGRKCKFAHNVDELHGIDRPVLNQVKKFVEYEMGSVLKENAGIKRKYCDMDNKYMVLKQQHYELDDKYAVLEQKYRKLENEYRCMEVAIGRLNKTVAEERQRSFTMGNLASMVLCGLKKT